jgi:hypothetical protein
MNFGLALASAEVSPFQSEEEQLVWYSLAIVFAELCIFAFLVRTTVFATRFLWQTLRHGTIPNEFPISALKYFVYAVVYASLVAGHTHVWWARLLIVLAYMRCAIWISDFVGHCRRHHLSLRRSIWLAVTDWGDKWVWPDSKQA